MKQNHIQSEDFECVLGPGREKEKKPSNIQILTFLRTGLKNYMICQ